MTDKFNPARLGEYVTFCDICGQKCWRSEAKIQSTYTGRGGTLACLECQDPIDYGLVPYKIRAEKNVPDSRDTIHTANPSAILTIGIPFDASKYDWTDSPQYLDQSVQTWDKLTFLTWDKWNIPWGF